VQLDECESEAARNNSRETVVAVAAVLVFVVLACFPLSVVTLPSLI
jgi:hypothetical protein